MIDLHSHLLFDVDDGALEENVTRQMLDRYVRQKVSAVAATSHSLVDLPQYQNAFERVSAIAEPLGVRLVPGREYSLAVAEEQSAHLQTLGSSRFLLVDLGRFSVNAALSNRLRDFSRPLLFAHPERLWGEKAVENARFLAERHEAFFQLNSGSFLGEYGKTVRKAAWALLNAGFCTVIASDAHDVCGITLAECRNLLESYYDAATVSVFFEDNPQRILSDLPPKRIVPHCSWISRIRQKF
ncbi:MAG: hypothetical protein MJ033_04335 [Victivallaceae bacterium]|nr:hypothetical protein [Victivallaceae bacterium]